MTTPLIAILSIIVSIIIAAHYIGQLRKSQNLKTLVDLINIYNGNEFNDIRARLFRNEEICFSEGFRLCNLLDEIGHITYELPKKDQKIAIEQWAETFIRCWIRLSELVKAKRPRSIGRDYAYFEWLASKSNVFHENNFQNNNIKFYNDKLEVTESYILDKNGLQWANSGNKLEEQITAERKQKIDFRTPEIVELELIKPSGLKGKRNEVVSMNIRKGFFRLTLVLSILIGIITPLCHEWIFDEKSVFNILFPDDWGNRSLQEKLKGTGLIVDTEYLLLPNFKRLNIERQLKERIISDEKSRPTKSQEKKGDIFDRIAPNGWGFLPDKGYSFSFKPGWGELSLLAFIGFASPWFIYLFIRWVIVGFIVGGFKGKSPKGGELNERVS